MQTENGETTEISFPNSFSLAIEPFIIENNKVEEKDKQIEPPPTPNVSNDTKVSTEALSFIIVFFETHHETQALFLQCLKEPSYAIIFKDFCTEGHQSRYNLPKKIRLNKKVGYLRWLNILPEGYQVLKKKGWKGLVGHPSDRRKCGIFLFFIFCSLFFSLFSFCHFIFVSNSNSPFDVCVCEKILLFVVDMCFGIQVWGTPWPLHTLVFSSHDIVSLDTLETMCHLSLEV
jgi:hypothetical protein